MSGDTRGDLFVLRRLAAQARPYRFQLLALFVVDLCAAPLALLNPVPLKIAVDSVIGSDPLPSFLDWGVPDGLPGVALLILVAVLQIGIVLLVQLQNLSSYVLGTHIGERLTLGFRGRLLRHVQRLSFAYHDEKGTVDSIYRIQYDTPAIRQILVYGAIPLVAASLTLGSMMFVMLRINLQLALIALIVAPCLFILSRSYKTGMRGRYRAVKQMESRALNVLQEVLVGFRLVKAFGREEDEQERFVQHSAEGMEARIRLSFSEGLFGLVINLVAAAGTAGVLFVGVRQVQANAITLGELLMVLAYLAQLYAPLKAISKKTATLQASLASAHRAFELLEEVPEVTEKANARSIKRSAGRIEFDNVSFGYEEGNPVLRDLSFVVDENTRVGIVGQTGAGKSTLVGLAMRFYDPGRGRILLDGIDLRDYRLEDLRGQFAMVLQEPVLFSTSIAENIAYGRPQACMDEIIAAAKAANAHEFVNKLPDGYQTLVGERGMRLSGGERQRVSIARAFLRDTPILILDEPTSSVDMATEALIIEAMERLSGGRTTLMIAHRHSTLRNCDSILVLDQGRLVDVVDDVAVLAGTPLALARERQRNQPASD